MDREAFLADIEVVCRKHGIVIAHEDRHGNFVLERLTGDGLDWLLGAQFDSHPVRDLDPPLEAAAAPVGDLIG